MKKIYLIIIWLILVGSIVLFMWNKETKTAWWYLDEIVELRQVKQNKLDEIKQLDEQIIEYRKIMDWIQYSWVNYLGLSEESWLTPEQQLKQENYIDGTKTESVNRSQQ